jgi:hypothetical protein
MTGSGTLADPFVIWDINDLQNMAIDLAAYYELGQDIDAAVTVGWNGGLGFEPVGSSINPFSGSFDGKEHKIIGLYINRPSTNYIGLFGFISGSIIKNASLENFLITGYTYVGSLAGRMYGSGVISNIHAVNAVIVLNKYGGGLIGSVSG